MSLGGFIQFFIANAKPVELIVVGTFVCLGRQGKATADPPRRVCAFRGLGGRGCLSSRSPCCVFTVQGLPYGGVETEAEESAQELSGRAVLPTLVARRRMPSG